ncbi:aldehyde dehydrogenase family protein [Devosia nitrariae]|uniref:Aldehyde dehydrogenase n=1 Tax=Devosia nitrariae TaxID=2071872 RepID=A0ABQ5WAU9_9HYPH|nr:aldehyde dehydrogenase family protein [Devosia nitrariae]GLQ57212.1 aldehyde dehydrogenase [Devosia nitrariae]
MIFKLLIDGRSVAGDASAPVINPATEQVLAECPRASEAQLNQAVAAAKAAFPGWAATPIDERRGILKATADRIDAHADELARLLTKEQGKPIGSAKHELRFLAHALRTHAGYELPFEVMKNGAGHRIEVRRKPLGVAALILPWNYPMALLGFKLPFALLAGNTVVTKPAPTTPLTTLRLGELIADLLPAGVLNVIADANDLGDALVRHPDVHKVAFTGSAVTGRKVMANASATLKRFSLELGGNDAAIVLEDADPKAVAPKVFASAFGNSGQVCIAIKRLYVHDVIYDAMCTELATLADAAIVGDGSEQGTTHGPLQNKAQFNKVLEILDDARKHGTVIAGGTIPDRPGYFLRPTIVRDIAEGTRLVDEEQFGPVLPVIRFSSNEDALARANNSPYGLGGSVWSANVERARALAERMDAGTVGINQHAGIDADVPLAGAKQSGIGTELGQDGLLEFTQLKVLASPSPQKPDPA